MIPLTLAHVWCWLFGHYCPVAEDQGTDRQCVRCWTWVGAR